MTMADRKATSKPTGRVPLASEREIVIVAFSRLEERHIAQIRAIAPQVRVEFATDQESGRKLAPTAEIMLGWNMSREIFNDVPRLRWIHSTGAGVDKLIAAGALDREIVVTSSSGIHRGLIEHVLAVLLALNRRLHFAIRNQTQHLWDKSARMIGEEIAGQTLGILGLGHIGAAIAAKAHALGMHIIGTKRSPTPVPGVDRVYPPDGLADVLNASDAVVIALPLTNATRGLIGPAEFQVMKPTAFLINIGRGAIVQEPALLAALRDHRLGGAALDVFAQEPLPPDSPFYDMENVIVTPHIAGMSRFYTDRAVAVFCTNLAAYLAGKPLQNMVGKDRGY